MYFVLIVRREQVYIVVCIAILLHKKFFQNVPQLMIQIVALHYSLDEKGDELESTLLITIVSMILTVFSILSSGLDYQMTKHFVNLGSIVLIRFGVESTDLQCMNYSQFKGKILFRKWACVGIMAKILKIETRQIDRLNPIQDAKGAVFTFLIETHSNVFDKMKNTLIDSISDKSLQNVCIYMSFCLFLIYMCCIDMGFVHFVYFFGYHRIFKRCIVWMYQLPST